ncbi:hypothetical protein [Actinoallomurus sp. CA-150999]|uniref:hypothetical protein n=1 Tax=Actinoallomurus sp. CA-150999 TaxID=3239887 RepID=UPI003D922353
MLREIFAVAKLPHVMDDNTAGLATIRRLTRSGGGVRCIYERAAFDEPDLLADIRRYTAPGEGVRAALGVLMRMWIVDGTRVVISLRDPVAGSASTTNIVIEHPALAQCLIYAFETIWSGADPVE